MGAVESAPSNEKTLALDAELLRVVSGDSLFDGLFVLDTASRYLDTADLSLLDENASDDARKEAETAAGLDDLRESFSKFDGAATAKSLLHQSSTYTKRVSAYEELIGRRRLIVKRVYQALHRANLASTEEEKKRKLRAAKSAGGAETSGAVTALGNDPTQIIAQTGVQLLLAVLKSVVRSDQELSRDVLEMCANALAALPSQGLFDGKISPVLAKTLVATVGYFKYAMESSSSADDRALAGSILVGVAMARGQLNEILDVTRALLKPQNRDMMIGFNKHLLSAVSFSPDFPLDAPRPTRTTVVSFGRPNVVGGDDVAEAIACDGGFVFIHDKGGLVKLGTGHHKTIPGQVVAEVADFKTQERGMMAVANGVLYYRGASVAPASLLALSAETLKELGTIASDGTGSIETERNPELKAADQPSAIFSEGRYLYMATATKIDNEEKARLITVDVYDPKENMKKLRTVALSGSNSFVGNFMYMSGQRHSSLEDSDTMIGVETANTFPADGYVTSITVGVFKATALRLMVVRRLAENKFQTVGEYHASCMTGANTFSLDGGQRIRVRKGDMLGFRSSVTAIDGYGGSSASFCMSSVVGDCEVGSIFTTHKKISFKPALTALFTPDAGQEDVSGELVLTEQFLDRTSLYTNGRELVALLRSDCDCGHMVATNMAYMRFSMATGRLLEKGDTRVAGVASYSVSGNAIAVYNKAVREVKMYECPAMKPNLGDDSFTHGHPANLIFNRPEFAALKAKQPTGALSAANTAVLALSAIGAQCGYYADDKQSVLYRPYCVDVSKATFRSLVELLEAAVATYIAKTATDSDKDVLLSVLRLCRANVGALMRSGLPLGEYDQKLGSAPLVTKPLSISLENESNLLKDGVFERLRSLLLHLIDPVGTMRIDTAIRNEAADTLTSGLDIFFSQQMQLGLLSSAVAEFAEGARKGAVSNLADVLVRRFAVADIALKFFNPEAPSDAKSDSKSTSTPATAEASAPTTPAAAAPAATTPVEGAGVGVGAAAPSTPTAASTAAPAVPAPAVGKGRAQSYSAETGVVIANILKTMVGVVSELSLRGPDEPNEYVGPATDLLVAFQQHTAMAASRVVYSCTFDELPSDSPAVSVAINYLNHVLGEAVTVAEGAIKRLEAVPEGKTALDWSKTMLEHFRGQMLGRVVAPLLCIVSGLIKTWSVVSLPAFLPRFKSLQAALERLNKAAPCTHDLSQMISKIVVNKKEVVECAHPYSNNMNETWSVSFPGCTSLTLTFDTECATESGCDYLAIYTQPDRQGERHHYICGREFPQDPVTLSGSNVYFVFTSDGSQVDWGFRVTVSSTINQTAVNIPWTVDCQFMIAVLLGMAGSTLISGADVDETEGPYSKWMDSNLLRGGLQQEVAEDAAKLVVSPFGGELAPTAVVTHALNAEEQLFVDHVATADDVASEAPWLSSEMNNLAMKLLEECRKTKASNDLSVDLPSGALDLQLECAVFAALLKHNGVVNEALAYARGGSSGGNSSPVAGKSRLRTAGLSVNIGGTPELPTNILSLWAATRKLRRTMYFEVRDQKEQAGKESGGDDTLAAREAAHTKKVLERARFLLAFVPSTARAAVPPVPTGLTSPGLKWEGVKRYFTVWKQKRKDEASTLELDSAITDDVMLFLKSTVDLDGLQRAILWRCRRARSRHAGFSLHADLLESGPVRMRYEAAASLPAALRRWPMPDQRYGHHPLDRIQSAPVALASRAVSAFERVMIALSEQLNNLGEDPRVHLLALEAWCLQFRKADREFILKSDVLPALWKLALVDLTTKKPDVFPDEGSKRTYAMKERVVLTAWVTLRYLLLHCVGLLATEPGPAPAASAAPLPLVTPKAEVAMSAHTDTALQAVLVAMVGWLTEEAATAAKAPQPAAVAPTPSAAAAVVAETPAAPRDFPGDSPAVAAASPPRSPRARSPSPSRSPSRQRSPSRPTESIAPPEVAKPAAEAGPSGAATEAAKKFDENRFQRVVSFLTTVAKSPAVATFLMANGRLEFFLGLTAAKHMTHMCRILVIRLLRSVLPELDVNSAGEQKRSTGVVSFMIPSKRPNVVETVYELASDLFASFEAPTTFQAGKQTKGTRGAAAIYAELLSLMRTLLNSPWSAQLSPMLSQAIADLPASLGALKEAVPVGLAGAKAKKAVAAGCVVLQALGGMADDRSRVGARVNQSGRTGTVVSGSFEAATDVSVAWEDGGVDAGVSLSLLTVLTDSPLNAGAFVLSAPLMQTFKQLLEMRTPVQTVPTDAAVQIADNARTHYVSVVTSSLCIALNDLLAHGPSMQLALEHKLPAALLSGAMEPVKTDIIKPLGDLQNELATFRQIVEAPIELKATLTPKEGETAASLKLTRFGKDVTVAVAAATPTATLANAAVLLRAADEIDGTLKDKNVLTWVTATTFESVCASLIAAGAKCAILLAEGEVNVEALPATEQPYVLITLGVVPEIINPYALRVVDHKPAGSDKGKGEASGPASGSAEATVADLQALGYTREQVDAALAQDGALGADINAAAMLMLVKYGVAPALAAKTEKAKKEEEKQDEKKDGDEKKEGDDKKEDKKEEAKTEPVEESGERPAAAAPAAATPTETAAPAAPAAPTDAAGSTAAAPAPTTPTAAMPVLPDGQTIPEGTSAEDAAAIAAALAGSDEEDGDGEGDDDEDDEEEGDGEGDGDAAANTANALAAAAAESTDSDDDNNNDNDNDNNNDNNEDASKPATTGGKEEVETYVDLNRAVAATAEELQKKRVVVSLPSGLWAALTEADKIEHQLQAVSMRQALKCFIERMPSSATLSTLCSLDVGLELLKFAGQTQPDLLAALRPLVLRELQGDKGQALIKSLLSQFVGHMFRFVCHSKIQNAVIAEAKDKDGKKDDKEEKKDEKKKPKKDEKKDEKKDDAKPSSSSTAETEEKGESPSTAAAQTGAGVGSGASSATPATAPAPPVKLLGEGWKAFEGTGANATEAKDTIDVKVEGAEALLIVFDPCCKRVTLSISVNDSAVYEAQGPVGTWTPLLVSGESFKVNTTKRDGNNWAFKFTVVPVATRHLETALAGIPCLPYALWIIQLLAEVPSADLTPLCQKHVFEQLLEAVALTADEVQGALCSALSSVLGAWAVGGPTQPSLPDLAATAPLFETAEKMFKAEQGRTGLRSLRLQNLIEALLAVRRTANAVTIKDPTYREKKKKPVDSAVPERPKEYGTAFRTGPDTFQPEITRPDIVTLDGNVYRCTNSFGTVKAPVLLRRGKWYYEVRTETNGELMIGCANPKFFENISSSYQGVGDNANGWGYDPFHRKKWLSGSGDEYGRQIPQCQVGAIIGILMDIDNRSISFSNNGTDLGVAFSNVDFSTGVYPAASMADSQGFSINYGQKPFVHKPAAYFGVYYSLGVPENEDPWFETVADGAALVGTFAKRGELSAEFIAEAMKDLDKIETRGLAVDIVPAALVALSAPGAAAPATADKPALSSDEEGMLGNLQADGKKTTAFRLVGSNRFVVVTNKYGAPIEIANVSLGNSSAILGAKVVLVYAVNDLATAADTAKFQSPDAETWEEMSQRLTNSKEDTPRNPYEPIARLAPETGSSSVTAIPPGKPVRCRYLVYRFLAPINGDSMDFKQMAVFGKQCADYERAGVSSTPSFGVENAKWTHDMDGELIGHCASLSAMYGLGAMNQLTFGDITAPSHNAFPLLTGVDLASIHQRYAVLRYADSRIEPLLTMVNLTRARQVDSLAARLCSIRTCLFPVGKMALWKSILSSTGSGSDDSRMSLTLDRLKAVTMKDNKLKGDDALRKSLFGQFTMQLFDKPVKSFRVADRAWEVKFTGEGATDAGGPYRESISNFVTELLSDTLTLFVPSPNGKHAVGINREMFVLNPGASSPFEIKMLKMLGRLIGLAIRSSDKLNLTLPSIFWKGLANAEVTRDDLKLFDQMTCQTMDALRTIESTGVTEEQFPYVIDEQFTTHLSNGALVELCPGGANRSVTFTDRFEFANLVEQRRLHESETQMAALREGLGAVVPLELLALFTAREIEEMVCGTVEVDLTVLRNNTKFELAENSAPVKLLWRVLENFTHEERRLFLRFVWGRSRFPAGAVTLSQQFTLQGFTSRGDPNQYLPVSHTCFFSLEWPQYTTYEAAREKLLFAIHNCTAIDTDFRA